MPLIFMHRYARHDAWNIQLLLWVSVLVAITSIPATASSGSTSSGNVFKGAIQDYRRIHVPLYRTETRKYFRRDQHSAEIGVGDDVDITYKIIANIGNTETSLVLDTGSSDLWLVSDACTPNCAPSGIPLYTQSSLHPTGSQVRLMYGDSRTGTQASGPIVTDTAGIAGLSVPDQCFAAIINTNTTVLSAGTTGILGLGFPPISVIWRQLLQSQLYQSPTSHTTRRDLEDVHTSATYNDSIPHHRRIPSFDFLARSSPFLQRRQTDPPPMPATPASASATINSFSTFGPLLTRLILQGQLDAPLVAMTLQRDTFSLGGNAGMLSVGALPGGVQDAELTWMPVRSYSVNEGGLPAPPDSPNEVYPLVWEIPIEDVYFDSVKLPRSTLSASTISLSGVLDTGNSLIRGPKDVVSHIMSQLSSGSDDAFDCSVPHNLTFQIGGALFPVDPRDFARAQSAGSHSKSSSTSTPRCTAALTATDPPSEGGFLYSWSLGDPFLKSVLAAYYYGNLTHPSQDPPRVGLLSTVPSNADDLLKVAVEAAQAAGGVFVAASEAAPSGAYVATATGIGGVPKAAPFSPSIVSSAARLVGNVCVGNWMFLVTISLFSIVHLLI